MPHPRPRVDLQQEARAYQDAYDERWPTADQVEDEVYRLTSQQRRLIREARNQAVRQRIAAENARQRITCACPVCLGHEPGTHGEALYVKKRCRCQICRNARTAADRERKRRRTHYQAAIALLEKETAA